MASTSSTFHIKIAKVTAHGSDLVSIPFILNKPRGDTHWMVPGTIFYDRALGEAVLVKETFVASIKVHSQRVATMPEKTSFKSRNFLGDTAAETGLLTIQKLVDYLEELNITTHCLYPTIKSLAAIRKGDSSSSLFPDAIPRCTLEPDELKGPYSLKANSKDYFKPSTTCGRQLEVG
jgi:hypothetical protein